MKKDENKVVRFSISLEPNLLALLDTRFLHKGYSSRSELVRDLIRQRLVEEQWKDKNEIQNAVLVIVYDHHQRELNQRIIDIQHKAGHEGLEILCSTHVHIDLCNCLETIILRGMAQQIEQFALDLAGLRGVKFSKLTRASKFSDTI
ncbi:nickel responsive regulator [Helicobacter sp. CLO-3]|uniref:nickel-responsive transcriptional regulator NikR n=1 Tax=unclassified Helicobacter TaxID=2593540 RepID=UPI00080570C1|nr:MULTISPECIES: nickel-responsive transcriptional regulator NikR [unclassified Helicobacter]OBV28874.1 nickel responsive regulator [Helicobacter sp. CLO-3]OHU84128.1 nickel responsive regulator [Helicobacter sp. CLO-3]